MRTFLIVVGILFLLWLVFLTVDRNGVQSHLNRHDQRFDQVDNDMNSLDERYQMKDGFLQEDNPIDEAEDKFDQTEDKADQKIEMPYEKEKTNENTNLRKDDNEFPKADNEHEIDLKPDLNKNKNRNRNRNDEVLDTNKRVLPHGLGLNDDSIVAFLDVTDHLLRNKESIEAFQLEHLQDEVITAFKVR